MAAIWTGTISFSLVAIPVQVHPATRDTRPQLHTVHAADGGRIRHRRFCELEERVVPTHEIVRGWEAPDGRTVVLTDEDWEALPLPTRHTIDVAGFLDAGALDPKAGHAAGGTV
ncbi:Ku protein [Streptomyces sp. MAR4 CNY-716]